MIKKTIDLIKENPMYLVIFLVITAIGIGCYLPIIPMYNDLMAISQEITQNPMDRSLLTPELLSKMLADIGILFLFAIAALFVGALAVAGICTVVADAVNGEKASIHGFFAGVKLNYGRTLLFFLLLIAFSIAVSIPISLISTPFTMLSLKDGYNPETYASSMNIVSIVSVVLLTFVYPFFMFWVPAVYLDRDTGVFKNFLNSIKACIKNYHHLLILSVIIMAPTVIVMIILGDVYALADWYILLGLNAFSAVIGLFLVPYLFIFYKGLHK